MYGGRVYGSGGYAAAHDTAREDVTPTTANDFAEGDRVEHKTFGPGVVVGMDGDKISVYFKKIGKTKTLLKGYAPIVKLG